MTRLRTQFNVLTTLRFVCLIDHLKISNPSHAMVNHNSILGNVVVLPEKILLNKEDTSQCSTLQKNNRVPTTVDCTQWIPHVVPHCPLFRLKLICWWNETFYCNENQIPSTKKINLLMVYTKLYRLLTRRKEIYTYITLQYH